MKHLLLFLIFLIATSHISHSQNRSIARGAETGELYLTGAWYGIYNPYWGPPYYDTLQTAICRITENGKKLTIQYDADYFANPELVMQPQHINADATPGVLYNKSNYSKNSYPHTALWVSFDYGKNWIFREDGIGTHVYITANVEGIIFKNTLSGLFKSENFGETFIEFEGGIGEPGLQYGEWWRAYASSLFQGKIFHSYNFFETYTEFPIDSLFMYGSMSGMSPDVYRGGLSGEVYINSWFPDWRYKVSFSADIGRTFHHVFISDVYNPINYKIYAPIFMSDRKPGVFYIIRRYEVDDFNPYGWHIKVCVDYYRNYGETLEATFCHDIHKNYEYEEVVCENITFLESNVHQNTIQLQWINSANNIRGYYVFRNDTRITNQLLTEPNYIDENLPNGNYEYYVRSYYQEGCVSDSSNHVTEKIGIEIHKIEEKDIVIFPNPTSGELHVTSYELHVTSIEVFDIFGKKLSSNCLITSSSHHKIDIANLMAGIYFVKIVTEKGIITKKIVKY